MYNNKFNPVTLSESFWRAIRYPRRQLSAVLVSGFVGYEAMDRVDGYGSAAGFVWLILTTAALAVIAPLLFWWAYITFVVVANQRWLVYPALLGKRATAWCTHRGVAFAVERPTAVFAVGLLLGGVDIIWLSKLKGSEGSTITTAAEFLGCTMLVFGFWLPLRRDLNPPPID